MVVMDDDEREVPFELGVRLLHRGDEIAVVIALDEMHDDFRVGLRGKRVSFGEQRLPQFAVVLDDPVEHDRELVLVATGQRMRVLLGDAAVRRPARVAEPVRRFGAVRARGLLQDLEVANRANVFEPVGFTQREARGVVAAVFEALQPLQEQRLRLSSSDISDDPAHLSPLYPLARPQKRARARPRWASCVGNLSRAHVVRATRSYHRAFEPRPPWRPLRGAVRRARCPTGARAREPGR
jgi:hypothetical protein